MRQFLRRGKATFGGPETNLEDMLRNAEVDAQQSDFIPPAIPELVRNHVANTGAFPDPAAIEIQFFKKEAIIYSEGGGTQPTVGASMVKAATPEEFVDKWIQESKKSGQPGAQVLRDHRAQLVKLFTPEVPCSNLRRDFPGSKTETLMRSFVSRCS